MLSVACCLRHTHGKWHAGKTEGIAPIRLVGVGLWGRAGGMALGRGLHVWKDDAQVQPQLRAAPKVTAEAHGWRIRALVEWLDEHAKSVPDVHAHAETKGSHRIGTACITLHTTHHACSKSQPVT
jgi:hypothetical protein